MKRLHGLVVFLGDSIVMMLTFFVTLGLGFGFPIPQDILALHVTPFVLLYLLWFLIFFIFDLYEPYRLRPGIRLIERISWALVACFLGAVLFFYLFSSFGISPKTNLAVHSIVFAALFASWRYLSARMNLHSFRKRIAVLGNDEASIAFTKEVNENPQLGYRGITVPDNQQERTLDFLNAQNISTLVVTPHITLSSERIKSLYRADIEVLDLSTAYEHLFQRIPLSLINDAWLVSNVNHKKSTFYMLFLRIMSITIALLVIVVGFPIWIIVAILVSLDGGPILYTQNRVGRFGKEFKLYKFRSMTIDAERNGPQWSSKNDPRTTRIGRIIRLLHLDEGPQMINIMRGDISFIGPRPERPEFVHKLEQQIPHYDLRHIIQPGFTGWAQIKFRYARSVLDAQTKFEYDLYYIARQNPLLDLEILVKTIRIIFTH